MNLEIIEEYNLSAQKKQAIEALLPICFPHYPKGRIFLNQLPNFRMLLWNEQAMLQGHLAVDHRLMNNAGEFITTFCISDFCVAAELRKQGYGTLLLEELQNFALEREIDFLVLLTSDNKVYEQNGFVEVKNHCRWLMMHAGNSFGIVSRRLDDGLMIKQIGDKVWKPGLVDFLGHIF